MITRLIPTLAMATVSGLAMYLATLGLPMVDSCVGVAGAAPSPTCGGDLRECLRLSAKTGIYGSRYVEADDVAKCMEAFNACIHGDAHPAPPTSTSATGGAKSRLPERLVIESQDFAYDCSVKGSAATCSTRWKTAPAEIDSFSQQITGTLTDLTMTGTATSETKYHNSAGCTLQSNESHPVTLTFDEAGTVVLHSEPYDMTVDYTCPNGAGTNTISSGALDFTAQWSQK